ncbi:hypothetical protein B484DRAFT_409667 [Ochromonadaceae sp. CCMP2298]|nr:hypothetical protein B484DRAFT_409667 [Ochromonadaceae sp. CCMP2298]
MLNASSVLDSLKCAAAYLLLTLYVDRDPQSATPLPRLTRTLSEVQASGGELVSVESGKSSSKEESGMHEFALLQSIISHHLSDIRHKSFAPQTHNLMKLLHRLVQVRQ